MVLWRYGVTAARMQRAVNRLKKKIFTFYIVLVIIGISTAGFFVSELAQSLYKQEVEQRLKTTATLIEHQLSEKLARGEKIDFNSEAASYAGILNDTSLLEVPAGENRIPGYLRRFLGKGYWRIRN